MINLKDLSFNYQNCEKLFKNITLHIPQGGIYGLLGRNGAGKTTFLKILSGLIFPTNGSCSVMESIPSSRKPNFLADIYYLPEDLYVPNFSAETYIKFYSPFYPHFNKKMMQEYLNEFNLPLNKFLNHFSYGQKKKFLIAFGLATNCRIFILDEPTNGLDIPSKTQFRKLLASTITNEKLFIISTHQVHDVENLIDNILVLEQGEIIFHKNLLDISKNLVFTQQQNEPDSTCIYSEKNLNGYNALIPNINNLDTHVNLEFLFNALLTNKQKIQAIFNEVN